MKDHPCLTCPLPDCDDKHAACQLRQAIRDYYWHARRKIEVSPELRSRKQFAYQELFGVVRNERRAKTDRRVGHG